MMDCNQTEPLWSRVDDRLYIGNIGSAQDINFLRTEDITAAVNLTGKDITSASDAVDFSFVLPSQELMENEFPKTFCKLATINSTLTDLVNEGHNVLVYCVDGGNKSMLVAGYYLISRGAKYTEVLHRLETAYGTTATQGTVHRPGLTMASFRKMLRLHSGAKK